MTTMTEPAAAHAGPHAGGRPHPPYMRIFYYLAGLTMLELVVPFALGATPGISVTILLAIAVWKILLIIRYFMHLKFDARMLGLIATTPALLASILAIGLWLEFGGWYS